MVQAKSAAARLTPLPRRRTAVACFLAAALGLALRRAHADYRASDSFYVRHSVRVRHSSGLASYVAAAQVPPGSCITSHGVMNDEIQTTDQFLLWKTRTW